MKITVKNQTTLGHLKPGDAFSMGDGKFYIVIDGGSYNLPYHPDDTLCLDLHTNGMRALGKTMEVVQYGIEVVLTAYSA